MLMLLKKKDEKMIDDAVFCEHFFKSFKILLNDGNSGI